MILDRFRRMLLLGCLLSMVPSNTVAQPGKAVFIPADVMDYDLLPPETKKVISRSRFGRIREGSRRQSERRGIERMLRNGLGDISRVDFAKLPIEFTDDQLERLNGLQAAYKDKLSALEDKLSALEEKVQRDFPELSKIHRWQKKAELREELEELRKEAHRELVDGFSRVVLPEQSKVLSNWDTGHTGLPRALVDFHLGESIGVDEERLERIKSKSMKLAEEVRSFQEKARQKAFELLDTELKPAEKARLVDFFGEGKLRSHFEGGSMRTILRHHSFQNSNLTKPKTKKQFKFDWKGNSSKDLPASRANK